MNFGHEGCALPRDDGGDGGDNPKQKEVAPGFVAFAEEAQDEERGDPRGEREIPFAADEETENGGDGEVEVTFVQDGLL